MSKGGKNDVGNSHEGGLIGKPVTDKETFGEALSKVGFVPVKVGRCEFIGLNKMRSGEK